MYKVSFEPGRLLRGSSCASVCRDRVEAQQFSR